jgi:thiosulfate/3-mercaptopyruvate sulfurtransferase
MHNHLTRPFHAMALAVLLLSAACSSGGSGAASDFSGPWGANVIQPADLVKELAGADKPVVLCTAPAVLYRTGHVPGAVLHGPTSSPAVIDELTAWAKALPRTTRIVIYCGCCPLAHCPNLRPAWTTLQALGFTNVRVLALPENFGVDWVAKGHPVER